MTGVPVRSPQTFSCSHVATRPCSRPASNETSNAIIGNSISAAAANTRDARRVHAPASTPVPTPTQARPATDRCHTVGLLISFAGSQGAAGTIVDTFRVANTQPSACTVYGFVGMLMLDSSGAPLTTRVVRNGGIFTTQAGPSHFLLQPATAASFQAAWSDVPHGSETTCPQAARLEITPPDEFDHTVIPVTGWNLAPCGAGEIDVTPIRAAGAGPA